MAWDPNKKGNYANLTKTASEHGGVDNFINDIHNEGYHEGWERGLFEGAGVATVAITIVIGACKGIKYLVQRYKTKKQTAAEHSKSAQNALRQMCNDEDSDPYDNHDISENDDK